MRSLTYCFIVHDYDSVIFLITVVYNVPIPSVTVEYRVEKFIIFQTVTVRSL